MSGPQRRPYRGFKPATLALALATAFSAVSTLVLANPQGGVAIHGQVSTSSPAPNKLNVITTNGAGTNHSVINWQSFSIPAGSVTNFQQPSAISTSINRVVTNTPSALFGTLSSNGRLVLVNQSGIAVGAGAVIDTAGFTASALRMSDADALAGRLRFGDAGTGSGANITIGGRIIARDGDVVLIAPNIELGGTAFLTAVNGSTVLAAGQQVEITGRGLEGIKMLVQAPTDAVRNLGMLQGDAVGIFAGTLRHSGEIQATTAAMEGGQVVLKAAGDAIVDGTAKILATGGAGAKGGRVDVLGNHVAVMDQAVIDASGGTGGGTIRVGGDYQGKNAEVPNASVTYFGAGSLLKVDALDSGNGGKVIVWADDTTRAYGNVSAKGGATAGDGGFVEVSGKRYLEFAAKANTSAVAGKVGTLLLDPMDVTISNLSTTGGNFSGSSPAIFDSSSSTSSNVSWSDIDSNLSSSNVEITSSSSAVGPAGNITVTAGHFYSSSNSLSLFAHNNVSLNSGTGIHNIGTGDINVYAGWDGLPSSGAVVPGVGQILLNNSDISTDASIGGSVLLRAGNTVTLQNGATSSGNNVQMDSFGSGGIDLSTAAAISSRGTFTANTSNAFSTMRVGNGVHSTGAMTLTLAGGLEVESFGGQTAFLSTSTDQTITAKYLDVLSHGSVDASVNASGIQTITTTGMNTNGEGIQVVSDGTANANLTGNGGAQNIQVNNANYLRVVGVSGTAGIYTPGAQTIALHGSGFNHVQVGRSSATRFANISSDGGQSITAGSGSESGGISVVGGTIDGQSASIYNAGGVQNLSTSGDISVSGGASSSGSNGAIASIGVGASATAQSITAHEISLVGGATGSNNGAYIQASNAASTQSITITGGGTLALIGGSGSGTSNRATISATGTTQTITFASGGTLNLQAGTVGDINVANIYASNSVGTQTVTGATSIAISGGSSGGSSTQGNRAVLESAGTQNVTADAILLQGGVGGTRNFAQIYGAKNQTINVGGGGLSMTGGGGGSANPKNFASLYQSGTTGFSQTINVSGGGDITLHGGSTSATNVADISSGSFSFIRADGDAQLLEFTAAGSAINITGGTVGSWNNAGIYAQNGTQTIRGSNASNAPDIALMGGASGGIDNQGNYASISADVGLQTISAANVTLHGGNGGVENFASIFSGTGGQTVGAASINLTAGTAGGATDAGNSAVIRSNTSQDITVGSGGITMLGGGGTGTQTDNGAFILQMGTAGTHQTITFNGSTSSLNMTGGYSARTNVGGSGHGSRALIESDGDSQSLIMSGGDINLTGGSAGSRAYAEIYAASGSTNQTLSGVGNMTLTGGSGGGFANEGNNAAIATDGANQSITATGNVELVGGSGGIENSASITAAHQNLDFGGHLKLTGSTGGDGNSGARIGGRGGSGATNTDLALDVGGDLTLQAGSTSGASIGTSGNSTGVTNTITISVGGNVDLIASATQGVRIGSPSSDIQVGNISITSTTGSITLSTPGSVGAAIRTLGNVTLSALNGVIDEAADSVIQANVLTANSDGAISLDSANNQVTSFNASNSTGGDIVFTNKAGSSLTLTGLTVVGGDAIISADDINITGLIDASDTRVYLRPTTLARDVNIETGTTVNSLSLSPTELALVHATELEIGRLDGLGDVNIKASLLTTDVNADTLRLVSGHNINSTTGGNIGSVGAEFNHRLTLQANNNVELTNGNIVLGNDRSLLVEADLDLSGVGNVTFGGGRFQVGANSDNTEGSMTVSGQSIAVTLSGNSNGFLNVQGDAEQRFTAANNLTFANNNSGSGVMQVVAEYGEQHFTATNGTFTVSAGTGTGTSTYVGTGEFSVAGQFISAYGMAITGGASGGSAVGGPAANRNFSQVYAHAEQTLNLGGGGITLAGGGGALTGNIASLYAVGNQTVVVSDGGDVVVQGGSSAGQNVGVNNGSLAFMTAEAGQYLKFTAPNSQITITGGSNGSGNQAGILASENDQFIGGVNPGNTSIAMAANNPTIIITGGSGGTASEANGAGIASFAFQEISAASMTLTGGSGVGDNGAYIASPDQLIVVNGNVQMTGGSSAGTAAGARIGGLAGAVTTNTDLELHVGGNLTLSGGSTSGAGIGSSPFLAGYSNTIVITAGGNVTLNPSLNRTVAIGHLATVLATEGGDISITAGGDIRLNDGGGGAGVAAIRTIGDVDLTSTGGVIAGVSSSTVVANALTAQANGNNRLLGDNKVLDLTMSSTGSGDVAFNSNFTSLMTVSGASGTNISLSAGSGGMALAGDITASGNLNLTSASGINQTAGAITVAGLTTVNADLISAVNLNRTFNGFGVNDFNQIALNGGNVLLRDKNDIAFAQSDVYSLLAQPDGSITLNGVITATSDSYNELTLVVGSGGHFVNNAGANALQTPDSNWLVFSQDPVNDTKGGLGYDFKQYGAVYGVSTVAGTGDGFLYTTAPVAITTANMTGTISKTYDANTSASLANASFTGVGIDGDLITLGGTPSAVYTTVDAGTGKEVTVTGLSFVSATNGGASIYGYTASLGSVVLNVGEITAANLTITIGAANKTYDRTTSATLNLPGATFVGLQGSDIVTVTGGSGNFADYNAGVGKLVNITGITLSGAANYTFSTTATTTATIDPAHITSLGSLGASNKTYDGTTTATLATGGVNYVGKVGADVLTVSGTGNFVNKNVGTEKQVNITGLTLGGPDAGNYILDTTSTSTSANISRANITVAGITASKEYDGTSAATVLTGAVNLSGKVAGDDIALVPSGLTASYTDANVGTGKTLNVSGIELAGADLGNYNLVGTSYTGDISRRALSIWTGSAADGLWSSAGNWDVAPTGANVAAVSIPASAGTVQFNSAAGNVYLQSVNSLSPFTMGSGNLDIATSLQASAFTQTGGTLSSLGSMTISGTISQTGGTIVSPDFTASSQGGMALNSQGNQISRLTATNLGSGDIVIKNTGVLSLMGMKNTGGNLDLNNIGGVTVLGQLEASGNIKLTANSPLTVGATGGVTGGGNVALTATNLTSAGNLTLDGPVNGDTVTLDAAGNMDINGVVVGTNGVSAKAGGNLTFGFRSVVTGTPTSYSAGGFTSDQRGGASNGPTSAGSVLTAFLDLFEKALDEQLNGLETTNPDGSKKRKTTDDTIVTEGEVCRP